jgi:hypothetical protein
MMLRELEQVAELTRGFAGDDVMAAWARSYLLAHVPSPPQLAPQAPPKAPAVRRRKVMLLGIASGTVVASFFVGWRLTIRPEEANAVAPPASSEAPLAVAPIAPSASTAQPVPAAPLAHEGADRPARRTRPSTTSSTPGHAREERSSPEVSKEKCFLDIGSEPAFAYVTIDGVKVGPTPIFGRELTPGTHRIQVSREGLGSKTFNLEMRAGDRITRVVKLP